MSYFVVYYIVDQDIIRNYNGMLTDYKVPPAAIKYHFIKIDKHLINVLYMFCM